MKLSNKTKKLLIKAIKFKRNLRSIFLNLIVNSKIIIKILLMCLIIHLKIYLVKTKIYILL